MASSLIVAVSILILIAVSVVDGNTTARKQLAAQSSLYKDTDPIMILTTANFEQFVYNQDTATLVEFYAGWCGHCQVVHLNPWSDQSNCCL